MGTLARAVARARSSKGEARGVSCRVRRMAQVVFSRPGRTPCSAPRTCCYNTKRFVTNLCLRPMHLPTPNTAAVRVRGVEEAGMAHSTPHVEQGTLTLRGPGAE